MKERPKEFSDLILKQSLCDETAVRIDWVNSSLTRFANNVIHQNVSEESVNANVQLKIGRKTARISTNRFDNTSLKRLLNEGAQIVKVQKEIPDLPDLLGPQHYNYIEGFDKETHECSPEMRSQEIKNAVEIAKGYNLNSAGFLQTTSWATLLANSKGLLAEQNGTNATFSMTAMTDSSSGWSQGTSIRVNDLDMTELSEIACRKAINSRNPHDLEPGQYTVILEPAAVADLIFFIAVSFNALAVYEKRSFMTDKVGQKIFGENINLYDDVYHQLQSGLAFDGEGLPKQRLVLIEKGVVKNLVYDCLTAKRMNANPTGHGFMPPNSEGAYPLNLVFPGQDRLLEDIITETERAILVTHLWYIRYNDPMQLTIQGMTRDGTFLIENGAVKYPVKNMRFNVSLPEILNNVTAFSRETRASGMEGFGPMVVPALRIEKFNFSSATLY